MAQVLVDCPTCNGTGYHGGKDKAGQKIVCATCKGKKQLKVNRKDNYK